MKFLPFGLAFAFVATPLLAWGDDPPKEDPPKEGEGAKEEPKPEEGIAWIHDYEEGKKKAEEEKKGLFVYLTPSWFT